MLRAYSINALLAAALTAIIILIYDLFKPISSITPANKIMLASGPIDATSNTLNLKLMGEMTGERQFLVQIKDHTVKNRVEEAFGIKFGEYIPHNTYILKGNAEYILNRARSMPAEDITFIGHMKPEYKTTLNLSVLEETPHVPRIQLYASIIDDADKVIDRLLTIVKDYNVVLTAVSPRKIVVSTPTAHAQIIMTTLANQEEVHWIERKLDLKILNHAAGIVMQADGKNYPESTAVGKKPFWEHGIRGEGEIVGIGDTGIDWDMCYFYDPNNDVPFDTVSDTHRKIRGYKVIRFQDPDTGAILTGDRKDSIDGHGTHTAGSIVGHILNTSSNYNTLSKYDGVAPGAKVFFTDLSTGDDLNVPDDINEQYFPDAYKAGAKIHTSSWGCSFAGTFKCEYDCNCYWDKGTKLAGEKVSNDYCKKAYGRSCCAVCNAYNSQAAEVDRFTWEHDDFLVLFSAGNIGHVSRLYTIGTPATSKNVLAVGASQTYNDWFVDSVDHSDLTGALIFYKLSSIQQCCSYTHPNAQTQMEVRINCCPTYMKAYYSGASDYFNQHNLAYFSSRGPTLDDGRYKPDLVAPGYNVQSMHSDGTITSFQCGTGQPVLDNDAAIISQKGTSMSAPLVAGAAALVRQYLRTIKNIKNPSGALVKGLLIHSAQPLTGTINLNGKGIIEKMPEEYPNPLAGYGLVSLGSVLGWDTPFVTQVFDRVDASKDGRYCYKVTKANEAKGLTLRATLSWYDRPSAVSGTATLVSDLDLDILSWSPGEATSTRYPGNNNYDYDSVNTVERSQAPAIELAYNMTVLVLVRAKTLGGAQNYSLVITLPKTSNFELTEVDTSVCDSVPVPKLPLDRNKILTIIVLVSCLFTFFFVTITCGIGCFLYKKGYGEPRPETNAGGHRLGTQYSGIRGKLHELWNSVTGWCRVTYARFTAPSQQRVTENHVRLEEEEDTNRNQGPNNDNAPRYYR